MILIVIALIVFLVLWLVEKSGRKKEKKENIAFREQANKELKELEKYRPILDAEAESSRIIRTANEDAKQIVRNAESIQRDAKVQMQAAERQAADIISAAKEQASDSNKKSAEKLRSAERQAADIISAAKEQTSDSNKKSAEKLKSAEHEAANVIAAAREKAKQIAGDAMEIKEKADLYEETATAMRNVINGYGDEWLKPTYSLLDELADEFSYTDAGKKLKEARAHTSRMVKEGIAAACDYVEENRRNTAIHFVIDAFNGKVDSILSKSKKDNYGKLEQQIRDAYSLVNYNGKAFRNARISEEYLDARLQELHWAVVVQEIRAKEIEEQREIRERMREEEKARREYERAQKAAAKEEAMLQKALEKAKAMLEKASEDQRAQYEAQITELAEKLKEAEEKSQRALSMAQQTRRGNVYVISNIGSFGENVYKVGMTRRLDPLDRVRELGDASVPFKFDVHAIIESEDAPALEHALHQELALMQMNKVNPRKEFFKVPLTDIKKLVEKRGLSVTWTMAAEAAEYKETLAIEEQMKNDPEVKKKWIAYAESLSESDESAEDEESA